MPSQIGVYLIAPMVAILGISYGRFHSHAASRARDLQDRLTTQGVTLDYSSFAQSQPASSNPEAVQRWNSLAEQLIQQPSILKSMMTRGWNQRGSIPKTSDGWELEQSIGEFTTRNQSLLQEIQVFARSTAPLRLIPEQAELQSSVAQSFNGLWIAAALELSARHTIRHGDVQATRDTLESLLSIRQLLSQAPFVSGALVRFHQSERCLQVLQNAIYHHLFDRSELAAILDSLQPYTDIDPTWHLLVRSEVALHWGWISDRGGFPEHLRLGPSDLCQRLLSAGDAQDRAWFLDCANALDSTPLDIATFRNLEKLMEARQKSCPNSLRAPLSQAGFLQFDSLVQSFVADAMRHRLACVAIGLELFQLEHSRYPSRLAEIMESPRTRVPPLPIQQFGYQFLSNNDAVVWCEQPPAWTLPKVAPARDDRQETWAWHLSRQ